LEKAEARQVQVIDHAEPRPLERVVTPDKRSIEEVASFLDAATSSLVKTLVFLADGEPVLALLRGDHDLNEIKLKNLLGSETLEMAPDAVVEKVTGAPVGFAGPVGPKVQIVADHTVAGMKNFIVGGNEKDLHLKNVNLGRDFSVGRFADIRNVVPGDSCPRCSDGIMEIWRGIEVGHVFKLGTKYSEALRATFLDADGKEQVIVMGCYGIGVSRTVAACIEQNHDKDGIIFPLPIAPFHCIVSAVNAKDAEVMAASEQIYHELTTAGVETLLDDRDERPGSKFKDADLIGVPLRIVVGSKNLADGKVELKHRRGGEVKLLSIGEAVDNVRQMVAESLRG
jgi:prolyl-tRNA synthetase